jgi:rhomboid protease GluP
MERASAGIEECFVDLHSYLHEGFILAEQKFNGHGGRQVANDVAGQDDSEDKHADDCITTVLSNIFPGYFENSWVMKFTQLDCAVYAFEVYVQPASMSWQTWLYSLGAAYGPAIAYGEEWWRLITPVFLHGHLQHLACNVLIQCRLGYRMESILGGFRFCVVYLGSAVIGNFLSIALDPFKVSVGASTSIFGLLGANMALQLIAWDSMTPRHKLIFVSIALLTGASLIWTPLNVDIIGHTAGLISGACLTILLLPDGARQQYGLPRASDGWALPDKIALTFLGLGLVEGSRQMSYMPLTPTPV